MKKYIFFSSNRITMLLSSDPRPKLRRTFLPLAQISALSDELVPASTI